MIRRILLGLVLLSTITCEASNGLTMDATRTTHSYGEFGSASLLSMLSRIVFNDESLLKFEAVNSQKFNKKLLIHPLFSNNKNTRDENWEGALYKLNLLKNQSNFKHYFTMIQSDLSPPTKHL